MNNDIFQIGGELGKEIDQELLNSFLKATDNIVGSSTQVSASPNYQNLKPLNSYDAGITYGTNQDKLRAYNQPFLDELAIGISNGIQNAVVSTVENIALIPSLGMNTNDSRKYTESVDKVASYFKNYAGEIYTEDDTRAWWLSQLSNLIDSGGSFAATALLTGGTLNFLGKVAKAKQLAGLFNAVSQGKNVEEALKLSGQVLKQGITTYQLSATEGQLNGLESSKKIKQKYDNDPLFKSKIDADAQKKGLNSEQYLSQVMDSAFGTTANISTLVGIPLNITGIAGIFAKSIAAKQFINKSAGLGVLDDVGVIGKRMAESGITKPTLLNRGLSLAGEMTQEGVEEGLQSIAGKIGEERAIRGNKQINLNPLAYGQILDESFKIGNKLFDKEFAASIMLGALGGGLQKGLIDTYNAKSTRDRYLQDLEDYSALKNDFIKNANLAQEKTVNLKNIMSSISTKEDFDSRRNEIQNLKEDLFEITAREALRRGNTDVLENDLMEIYNIDSEKSEKDIKKEELKKLEGFIKEQGSDGQSFLESLFNPEATQEFLANKTGDTSVYQNYIDKVKEVQEASDFSMKEVMGLEDNYKDIAQQKIAEIKRLNKLWREEEILKNPTSEKDKLFVLNNFLRNDKKAKIQERIKQETINLNLEAIEKEVNEMLKTDLDELTTMDFDISKITEEIELLKSGLESSPNYNKDKLSITAKEKAAELKKEAKDKKKKEIEDKKNKVLEQLSPELQRLKERLKQVDEENQKEAVEFIKDKTKTKSEGQKLETELGKEKVNDLNTADELQLYKDTILEKQELDDYDIMQLQAVEKKLKEKGKELAQDITSRLLRNEEINIQDLKDSKDAILTNNVVKQLFDIKILENLLNEDVVGTITHIGDGQLDLSKLYVNTEEEQEKILWIDSYVANAVAIDSSITSIIMSGFAQPNIEKTDANFKIFAETNKIEDLVNQNPIPVVYFDNKNKSSHSGKQIVNISNGDYVNTGLDANGVAKWVRVRKSSNGIGISGKFGLRGLPKSMIQYEGLPSYINKDIKPFIKGLDDAGLPPTSLAILEWKDITIKDLISYLDSADVDTITKAMYENFKKVAHNYNDFKVKMIPDFKHNGLAKPTINGVKGTLEYNTNILMNLSQTGNTVIKGFRERILIHELSHLIIKSKIDGKVVNSFLQISNELDAKLNTLEASQELKRSNPQNQTDKDGKLSKDIINPTVEYIINNKRFTIAKNVDNVLRGKTYGEEYGDNLSVVEEAIVEIMSNSQVQGLLQELIYSGNTTMYDKIIKYIAELLGVESTFLKKYIGEITKIIRVNEVQENNEETSVPDDPFGSMFDDEGNKPIIPKAPIKGEERYMTYVPNLDNDPYEGSTINKGKANDFHRSTAKKIIINGFDKISLKEYEVYKKLSNVKIIDDLIANKDTNGLAEEIKNEKEGKTKTDNPKVISSTNTQTVEASIALNKFIDSDNAIKYNPEYKDIVEALELASEGQYNSAYGGNSYLNPVVDTNTWLKFKQEVMEFIPEFAYVYHDDYTPKIDENNKDQTKEVENTKSQLHLGFKDQNDLFKEAVEQYNVGINKLDSTKPVEIQILSTQESKDSPYYKGFFQNKTGERLYRVSQSYTAIYYAVPKTEKTNGIPDSTMTVEGYLTMGVIVTSNNPITFAEFKANNNELKGRNEKLDVKISTGKKVSVNPIGNDKTNLSVDVKAGKAYTIVDGSVLILQEPVLENKKTITALAKLIQAINKSKDLSLIEKLKETLYVKDIDKVDGEYNLFAIQDNKVIYLDEKGQSTVIPDTQKDIAELLVGKRLNVNKKNIEDLEDSLIVYADNSKQNVVGKQLKITGLPKVQATTKETNTEVKSVVKETKPIKDNSKIDEINKRREYELKNINDSNILKRVSKGTDLYFRKIGEIEDKINAKYDKEIADLKSNTTTVEIPETKETNIVSEADDILNQFLNSSGLLSGTEISNKPKEKKQSNYSIVEGATREESVFDKLPSVDKQRFIKSLHVKVNLELKNAGLGFDTLFNVKEINNKEIDLDLVVSKAFESMRNNIQQRYKTTENKEELAKALSPILNLLKVEDGKLKYESLVINEYKKWLNSHLGLNVKVEDSTLDENEVGSKNQADDSPSFEKEMEDTMSNITKVLISSIVKRDNKGEIYINEYGILESQDFNTVKNELIQLLSNKDNNDMLIELSNHPKYQDLYEILTREERLDKEGYDLVRRVFLKDFHKRNLQHYKIVIDGDGNANLVNSAELFTKERIKVRWFNNFVEQQGSMYNFVKGDNTTIERLGRELKLIEEDYTQETINNIVTKLSYALDKPKVYSLNQINLEELSINEDMNGIFGILSTINEEFRVNQSSGLSGKTYYNVTQTTFANQLVDAINNKQEYKFPILESLWTNDSKFLQYMKKNNQKIVLFPMSGTDFETDGQEVKGHTEYSKTVMDMLMIKNNKLTFLPTHSDKSTNYAVNYVKYIGKSPVMEEEDYIDELVDFLISNYYKNDLALMKVYGKSSIFNFDYKNETELNAKKGYLRKKFTKEFNDFRDNMIANGVNNTISIGGELLSTSAYENDLAKYWTNRYVHNIEMHKLFYGNPNTLSQPEKRAAYVFSTKDFIQNDDYFLRYVQSFIDEGGVDKYSIADREDGKYDNGANENNINTEKVLIMSNPIKLPQLDINVANMSKSYDSLIEMYEAKPYTTEKEKQDIDKKIAQLKQDKEGVLESYRNTDPTDGQGIISLDLWREALNRMGRWNPVLNDIYIKVRENKLLEDAELKYVINTQKFMYSGVDLLSNIYKDHPVYSKMTDVSHGEYHKYSLMPLIPQIIGTETAAKLRNVMIKNQIGYVIYPTADKTKLLVEPHSFEDVINDTYNKENTTYINVRNLGIQSEVANEVKNKVTDSSQMRILIFLNEQGTPEQYSEYVDLYEKWYELTLEESLTDFGLNEFYEVVDGNKLKEFLQKNITERDNINIIEGIESINGNIDSLPNGNRIMQIILSKVDEKIRSRKVNGEGYIQASSVAFADDLKFYRIVNGKTLPAQIVIPLPKEMKEVAKSYGGINKLNEAIEIAHNKREEGTVLTEEEQDLLDSVTYTSNRIPGQDINSLDYLEVKRFVNPVAGVVALVPYEITTKVGSDFDVDKLNTYRPYLDKKGKKKYQEEINEGQLKDNFSLLKVKLGELEDKAIEALNRDAELDSDTLALANVILPLPEITDEDIAEEIKDKDYYNYLKNLTYDKYLKSYKKKRKESIINGIQDIMKQIMSNPMNYEYLIKPNSAAYLQSIADSLDKGGKLVKDVTDLYNQDIQNKLFFANNSGKQLVGIETVWNTAHQKFQMVKPVITLEEDGTWRVIAPNTIGKGKESVKYNILIPKEWRVIDGNTITLGKNETAFGKYINNIFSQQIDGTVDIAKAPWITRLGVNLKTANWINFAIEMGADERLIFQLANEKAIKMYDQIRDINESWFYKAMGMRKTRAMEIQYGNMANIDNEHIPYITILALNKEAKKDARPIQSSINEYLGLKQKYYKNGIISEDNKKAFKKQIEELINNELSGDSFDFSFNTKATLSEQKNLVMWYHNSAIPLGKIGGAIIKGMNYDSKAIDNNVTALYQREYELDNLRIAFPQIDDLLNNTLVRPFYNAHKRSRYIVKDFSMLNDMNFNNIFTTYMNNANIKLYGDKKIKLLSDMKNDLLLYLFHNKEVDYKGNKVMVKDIADEIQNNNGVVALVKELQEREDTKDLKIVTELYKYSKDNGLIKFHSRQLTLSEQNTVIESFKELMEIDKDAAMQIAIATMLQSGLNRTQLSFTDKVPVSLFQEMLGDVVMPDADELQNFMDKVYDETIKDSGYKKINYKKRFGNYKKMEKENAKIPELELTSNANIAEGVEITKPSFTEAMKDNAKNKVDEQLKTCE
jgi:hypothetical protein